MYLRRVFVLSLALQGSASLSTVLCLRATALAQTHPLIEHIEPTAGPPGTRVRIVGRGFQRSYHVLFNEHPVTASETLPERITVVVPEGSQSGRFVLSNGSDEVETEVFRVTVPEPAPVIAAIDPTTSAPGGEVTIRGEHFSARPSDNTVRIGNLPMVVRSGDTTALHVIVPDGTATGPVFVRTAGGEGRSTTELSLGARLVVREMIPLAATPGARVTLRGAGFATTPAGNRVAINARPVRVVRASAGELELELPLDATTGTLTVDVPGAGHYETAQRLFVGPAPLIRAMDPTSGAPGTRVTLRGEHFGADLAVVSVTLGDRPMAVISVAPGEIVATVPEGASTGRIAVTTAGIGPVPSTADFTVRSPSVITRVEPRSGDVGDRVTLTGTGFSATPGQDEVLLGTTPARVVSATETALVVEVPEAHSAPWYVNVQGNGRTHTREPFMVTQRPRITSVDPERGVPGSRVTLHGVNFPGDRTLAAVRLNGAEVPIDEYSREAIVVTVPRGAQSGRFDVIGRLQGTGHAPTDFVVLSHVTLREVVPSAGPVGSSVTLHGEGFEPDPARIHVRLGTLAVHPSQTSTTEIVFAVPRGARDGVVAVEADGRQPVVSQAVFTVTVPPVLQGFTPPHGPSGTRVTLRGRNLGTVVGNVGVTLGTIACPVAAVTPTAVTCEIPEGAMTGRFTVRVANAGEVRAATDFRVDTHQP